VTTPVSGSYDLPDEPYADLPVASDRSRSVALVLGLLGGIFGLHRFYAGRPKSAVVMVLTVGGLGFWWLYDLVMLVAGEFRDVDGRMIRNWPVAEVVSASGSAREVGQMRDDLDRVQHQLAELAERMDFAERLLTQQRERDRLPKGAAG
jgi:hypothetical protein